MPSDGLAIRAGPGVVYGIRLRGRLARPINSYGKVQMSELERFYALVDDIEVAMMRTRRRLTRFRRLVGVAGA